MQCVLNNMGITKKLYHASASRVSLHLCRKVTRVTGMKNTEKRKQCLRILWQRMKVILAIRKISSYTWWREEKI